MSNITEPAWPNGHGRPPAQPVPGIYRHYKGQRYKVLGLARHSETDQWLVIYQALYGTRGFWARPREIFLESVPLADRSVARFALEEATGEAGFTR